MNHLENDFQHMNDQILILKRTLKRKKTKIKIFFSDRSGLNINDRMHISSSKSDSRRSSNDSIPRNHQIPYTILTGPKNPNEFVDCQIIIVNVRQRFYLLKLKRKKKPYFVL